MYGLVNKAFQEMIQASDGEATWDRIRDNAGVDLEVFVSNEAYPDSVTYALVGAASAELGISAEELLQRFGHHWVLVTAKENYGDILAAGGATLQEFLFALPDFHARIGLLMPHLQPPGFRTHAVDEHTVRVEYHSKREGLAPMMLGLLHALADLFSTRISVDHVMVRAGGADHDEFVVRWDEASP